MQNQANGQEGLPEPYDFNIEKVGRKWVAQLIDRKRGKIETSKTDFATKKEALRWLREAGEQMSRQSQNADKPAEAPAAKRRPGGLPAAETMAQLASMSVSMQEGARRKMASESFARRLADLKEGYMAHLAGSEGFSRLGADLLGQMAQETLGNNYRESLGLGLDGFLDALEQELFDQVVKSGCGGEGGAFGEATAAEVMGHRPGRESERLAEAIGKIPHAKRVTVANELGVWEWEMDAEGKMKPAGAFAAKALVWLLDQGKRGRFGLVVRQSLPAARASIPGFEAKADQEEMEMVYGAVCRNGKVSALSAESLESSYMRDEDGRGLPEQKNVIYGDFSRFWK